MRIAPALTLVLALCAPPRAGDGVPGVLEALRSEHGFPGATVAWIGSDGSVQSRATGWADPDAELPMAPDSRMLAASIGKSFVAAAVLALESDGVLDLDDPLSAWLGARPWFGRLPNHATLTLRHLLTHSGGLPDHVELPAFRTLFMSVGPEDPAPAPEELISLVLDAAPLFPWSGRALPGPYLDAMLAGVPMDAETPGASYGLAVSIRRDGAFGEMRGHGGWIPGYVSSLRYYPAHDVAIAIQVNTDIGMLGESGAFDAIEREITGAILGGSR